MSPQLRSWIKSLYAVKYSDANLKLRAILSVRQMPNVIDYPHVVAQAQKQGMRSLYHNSGAFGLREGVETYSVGWVGPPDPSIRAAAQALTRFVPAPHGANLAGLFRT